jgi:serine/threonine protein kinase
LREALCSQLGTPLPCPYLAPEIIGGGERNEASVVYSLGILAAKLFSGQEVFQELEPSEVKAEREAYIENFKETKLPSFIKLLLNVNPNKRPPLMQVRDFFLRLSRQRSK